MAAQDDKSDNGVGFDVVAVLPAGGCGVRMNMELPKQFYQIMGRPLISYTLAVFESVSWIKEIIVPIGENYMKEGQQILEEFSHYKVRLAHGGSTRHRSIWNGIQAITVDGRPSPKVVILHDAVRPFVDQKTLHRVTIAASKHGAAGAIRPLASTVIAQSSDGFLDHSLDRSKFRASEMPQAFQYELIKKAYEQCTDNDFEYGTECLHLAQTYCETRALLLDGPESLWKVTYRKDLYSVEGVLREEQNHSVVIMGQGCLNFFDMLNEMLQKRNVMVTHLNDAPQEEQVLIQKVLGITSKPLAAHASLSVVVLIDNTKSEEKTSPESFSPNEVKRLLQAIPQRSNSFKRIRLVTVGFSSTRMDFNAIKVATEEMKWFMQGHAVECFGVFVCQQDKSDESHLTLKAAELTTSTLLDVPSVLNGQTFDTIT
ncbi:D-ribitol-5-phosphate cytidylyltransferase-like isoform X2 [Montipora foliosa]|uniref:D-ribitol-5-phosphate cytidylyltransferase-like isoform X2 n=1 Tax=Montipora foliosa TaxID=591990 RepID=UPI0035F1C96C